MRVIHVLQGLHAAGIEHLALQLIAHSPAGTHGVLLNLDPEAQDLRQAFQRCCERGQLETILDRKGRDGLGLAFNCWRVFRRQRPQAHQQKGRPAVAKHLVVERKSVVRRLETRRQ